MWRPPVLFFLHFLAQRGFRVLLAGCGLILLVGLPPAAIAGDSSSSSKIAKQALAARNAGQTEHSVELYRLALELNPDDPKSWFYQGLNFYDLNRYADCEKAFLHVIERAPDNGGAYAFLGLVEFRT